MADGRDMMRPLNAQERVLVAAAVSVVASERRKAANDICIGRLRDVLAYIDGMSDAHRFSIEFGPATTIFWAARELVKWRQTPPPRDAESYRYFATLRNAVLRYFIISYDRAAAPLGLPLPTAPQEESNHNG